MAEPTITSVLLPLATEDDAQQTAASLRQYLPADTTIHAVHVIEHTEGGIDPASPTQLEEEAQQMFATLEESLSEAPYELRSEVRYGTDLVRTLIDVADEFDVSHIVFRPRPSNRFVDILAGDTTRKIIKNTTRPVLVLPTKGEDSAESK